MYKLVQFLKLNELRRRQIFQKNREYLEFVMKSTLRTNAELSLKHLLKEFEGTKLNLGYRLYEDDRYHIEIDSELKGTREDLVDLISGFADVHPEIDCSELIQTTEDKSVDVVELETFFLNRILNHVLGFLQITDWEAYFLEHADMFDGVPYLVDEEWVLHMEEERLPEN